MIDFIHLAGRKADLVAVGGISRSGGRYKFPLRQLPRKGPLQWPEGIRRAGDAHGGVDVASA
jgi:hypothetical protein